MLYGDAYLHVEHDYRGEVLRRSFRPLLGRRRGKELNRTSTEQSGSDTTC